MNQIRTWLPDAFALALLVALTVASLVPFKMNYQVHSPLTPDLIIHFGCYLVLSLCALYRRYSLQATILTALALIVYGGIIEVIQVNFGRSPSVLDVGANTLGVATGWLTLSLLRR